MDIWLFQQKNTLGTFVKISCPYTCESIYGLCFVLLIYLCWYQYQYHDYCVFIISLALNPEKAMAPHSSTIAWKIPWTEQPGRLQSMGSWRVGHDWATSLTLFTFMHWRRKWQPTPVFLPGESQGRGSLMGCCLLGHTESDMTEVT